MVRMSLGRGRIQRCPARPRIRRTCFAFVAVVGSGIRVLYALALASILLPVCKKTEAVLQPCALYFLLRIIRDFLLAVHYFREDRVHISQVSLFDSFVVSPIAFAPLCAMVRPTFISKQIPHFFEALNARCKLFMRVSASLFIQYTNTCTVLCVRKQVNEWAVRLKERLRKISTDSIRVSYGNVTGICVDQLKFTETFAWSG